MAIVDVPDIIPVIVLKLKPAGSAGLTEYDVGVPPVIVGELVPIAVPGQYTAGLVA